MPQFRGLLIFLWIFYVATLTTDAQKIEYLPNEFIVEFSPELNSAEIAIQADSIIRVLPNSAIERVFKSNHERLSRFFWLRLPASSDNENILQEIQKIYGVKTVERVPKYFLSFTPSDLHSSQWSLKKINAEKAWDHVKGSGGVVIAVVDDAVYTAHEDLVDNLWKNTNEIPGNSIDDDGNGYVDDVSGWDAVYNDNDPSPQAAARIKGKQTHGTHVAGIATGRTNNAKGMSSISFNTRLMPIKASWINSSGNAQLTTVALARGIEYAVTNKADIINMSWGGYGKSSIIEAALTVASDSGIVLVAAAGNGGRTPYATFFSYPASYSNVISVGASDQNDKKANFSQYNSAIDLMAPGVSIYSTLAKSTTTYGALSGTSMASPLTAGLCGLVLSKNQDLTPSEIEKILKQSSVDISALNPGYSGRLGSGRINAEAAILNTPAVIGDFNETQRWVCKNTAIQFFDLSRGTVTTRKWLFPGASPSSSSAQNPTVTYASNGIYDVTLIVSNAHGSDTVIRKQYITIAEPSASFRQELRRAFVGQKINVQFTLNGSPPFDLYWKSGGVLDSAKGIKSNSYNFITQADQSKVFKLVQIKDASCTNSLQDSMTLLVDTTASIEAYDCTSIKFVQKISDTKGKFTASFSGGDHFGRSATGLGDLDGDGYEDIAVAAHRKRYGGTYKGAVYILFLDSVQEVKGYVEISAGLNGFTPGLGSYDDFGSALANVGDLNDDGVIDIAVGAVGDDDGGSNRGAVYILFLNKNGTVKSSSKISSTVGKVTGLTNSSNFGIGLTGLGDINGDSIEDIAVGAYNYNSRGAVYVLTLDTTGKVKTETRIASGSTGFTNLDASDYFGTSLATVPDLNNDGVPELLVGTQSDDDGQTDAGAAYLLMLKKDGSSRKYIKYSNASNGLAGKIPAHARFGRSMRHISTDGDKITAYISAIGFHSFVGGFFQLTLDTFGNVDNVHRYDSGSVAFSGQLNAGDQLGYDLVELKNAGKTVYVTGALNDDDGGSDRGAVYVFERIVDTCFKSVMCTEFTFKSKVSDIDGGFNATFSGGDRFGRASCLLGDLDGDGYDDIAVSAHRKSYSSTRKGAVYILFLDSTRGIKSYKEISDGYSGFNYSLDNYDDFGSAIANIGDLDNDGVVDLAVGASADDDGGTDRGAIYILFMNKNGTVKSAQKISSSVGSVSGLSNRAHFGISANGIGDINQDKIPDLAVGAYSHDERGAVLILMMNRNGSVKAQSMIKSGSGGFATLDKDDYFGTGLSAIPDLNNDGVNELAVGTQADDDGGTNAGAFYVLFLKKDGTLRRWVKGSNQSPGFESQISPSSWFGRDVEYIYTDSNSIRLAVTGVGVHNSAGALWIVHMDTFGTVLNHMVLDSNSMALKGKLKQGDNLGYAITAFNQGSFNGDLLVSANLDGSGGNRNGAFYLVNMQDTCIEDTVNCQISAKPKFTTACLGSGVELIDTTVFDATTQLVQRRWEMGDTSTYLGSDTVFHKYKFAGKYQVKLIINAMHTQSGNICQDTAQFTVIVNDTLIYQLAQADSICEGDSLTIGPTELSCAVSPVQFDWTPKTYLKNGSSQLASVSPPSSMWYYVTMQTASKLTVKDSIFVYVDNTCCKSHANFEPSSNEVCVGDSLRFTNTSKVSGGIVNYDWYFGSGVPASFSGENPPYIVFRNAGLDTITLVVNDICGYDTIEKIIWVNPSPIIPDFRDTAVCKGDTVDFDISRPFADEYFTWTPSGVFFDSSTNQVRFLASDNQTIVFTLWDNLSQCSSYDTVQITAKPYPELNLGRDTFFCEGDSHRLSAYFDQATYIWQDGSTKSYFTVQNSGNYWVESDLNGCKISDSIEVIERPLPIFDLGPDTFLCTPDSLVLDASVPNASYNWDNMDTSAMVTVKQTSTRYVTVTLNQCSSSDTIFIQHFDPPQFSLGNDTFYCKGDSIILNATYPSSTYLWQDGSNRPTFSVKNPGVHWVMVTKDGCSARDSIFINERPVPRVNLGLDTFFCESDQVVLDAFTAGATYLWSDNSSSSNLAVAQPGQYWVQVTVDECEARDSILVAEIKIPDVSLGPDTAFCEGSSIRIGPPANQKFTYQWSSSQTSTPINITKGGLYRLTVAEKTCENSDSINVATKPTPYFTLGLDTTICRGDSMELSPSLPSGATYSWHDNSTGQTFYVLNEGEYSLTAQLNECEFSDTINVEVEDCACSVYFPTAFSPNGDLVNDTYKPVTDCNIELLHFSVYNRLGVVVFTTSDINKVWDGTYKGEVAMQDVYAVEYFYNYFVDGRAIEKQTFSKVVLLD